MGIIRHGKNYWLDLRVRGKRVRRSLGTDEYYLALDRAKAITDELRAPRPAGTPIAEFFDKYRAWARETKSSSFRTEDYRLKIIKAWCEGAGLSTLDAITPWHIEQMRADIRAHDRRTKAESPQHGKTATKGTANRYCALLRTVFNKARDWGVFKGENPVSRVKFYREGGKVRPLSEKEIAAVIEAARAVSADKDTSATGRAIYDICRLVLDTGLRRSEVLNLRWADIIDEEIRVRGKGGKVRMVPLNDDAQRLLRARPRLTAYVFDIPNRNSAGVLRRVTETITRKTGVPFHLHQLRHAMASRLMAAGVDIVTISDLLGHGRTMTTLLYTHSSPKLKREAVDLLGKI